MRPKGTVAQLEQRRRLAVALVQQGMRQADVARAVGRSRASVTRWCQAFQRRGGKGLAAKPHPGGRSRLTDRDRQRLARLLLKGPRKHGYRTDLWTLARVTEVIDEHFGVAYHPSQVWRILRAMGWSCQKPERRARERDEETIRRWRQEDWPRIERKPAEPVGASFSSMKRG